MTLTHEDFLCFRDLFYAQTGIRFDGSRKYFVEKRLIERVEATRSASVADYLQRMRALPSESQLLTNLMTVNETYFFREHYQFDCLVRSLLPELARGRSRSRPIRIWVMPCSTGEEPYSIAIWLLEHWASGLRDWDVEIVASDIDTEALRKAAQGVYETRAMHLVPEKVRAAYFKQLKLGVWQVADDLRRAVQLTQVNLFDRSMTEAYRGFDVVFCRNLLIYFDEVSRRQAVRALYDALSPGGFACLGHSESMSRMSDDFVSRSFPDAVVHQKPA